MRISRHQMFMEIARTISKRSACLRLNVGAILVDQNNNIVSIGYNGPASGERHCETCQVEGKGGCSRSHHAEHNAIQRLALSSWNGALSLYVTHSPCLKCAKEIHHSTIIKRVFFEVPYRDSAPLIYLDKEVGIEVYQVIPSGQVFPYDKRP